MKTFVQAICVGMALTFAAANIGFAETATTPTTTTTTTTPTTTPPPKKTKTTKVRKTTKPRSAKSIECSRQATAKGLHGKERRVFRAKCLAGKT